MNYDDKIMQIFEELLNYTYKVPKNLKNAIVVISQNGEKSKGAMTVVATGLIYKYFHPEQDVRFHQSKMIGGYSGRSFDNHYVTPFLRNNDFPCMAESGWLTRSLEQALPYDLEYPGQISGTGVKEAFLEIYSATVDGDKIDIKDILACFFQELVKVRDASKIDLICPSRLTIQTALKLIQKHIEYKYNTSGGARLPNIAIYSAYKTAINASSGRYLEKDLIDLNSHTSSDKSSKSIGDIQINDNHGNPFEGIEIKARPIEPFMLEVIYKKIQEFSTVERYYLLTTEEDDVVDEVAIQKAIHDIRLKHGCDVIVNGVYTTLKYFLRLSSTDDFIKLYTSLMENDDAIKYEHKEIWNNLCLKI